MTAHLRRICVKKCSFNCMFDILKLFYLRINISCSNYSFPNFGTHFFRNTFNQLGHYRLCHFAL
ncbi:hypothetical protein KSS87_022792 [Heliosperma pusillum]|nr:hypothetical protein KSS87_022792 [Heliosperma pusillum]